MRKALPSGHPGTWFAVPLPKGGFGLCLVARWQKRRTHSKLFVYIFSPKFEAVEDLNRPIKHRPNERVAFTFTFDDQIKNGRWPIVDCIDEFRKEEWPLPPLKSGPIGGGPDYKRRFELTNMSDDLIPGAALGEHILENISDYPNNSTHVYISFEEFVERMIEGRPLDIDR